MVSVVRVRTTEGYFIKKLRTVASILIMVLAGIVGLFVGASLQEDGLGGALLFSMIAGIACIVYTIDNREK